mmetsp:Transcript_73027/g.171224  ORF Transcript_73027/g.171224 Transcript_73027/m.171224 type:complete len:205 (+) Transcript_73027:497-1111(+)
MQWLAAFAGFPMKLSLSASLSLHGTRLPSSKRRPTLRQSTKVTSPTKVRDFDCAMQTRPLFVSAVPRISQTFVLSKILSHQRCLISRATSCLQSVPARAGAREIRLARSACLLSMVDFLLEPVSCEAVASMTSSLASLSSRRVGLRGTGLKDVWQNCLRCRCCGANEPARLAEVSEVVRRLRNNPSCGQLLGISLLLPLCSCRE